MELNESLKKRGISFSEAIFQIAGYAFGNYTTFCPTQLQLDIFDLKIEREIINPVS